MATSSSSPVSAASPSPLPTRRRIAAMPRPLPVKTAWTKEVYRRRLPSPEAAIPAAASTGHLRRLSAVVRNETPVPDRAGRIGPTATTGLSSSSHRRHQRGVWPPPTAPAARHASSPANAGCGAAWRWSGERVGSRRRRGASPEACARGSPVRTAGRTDRVASPATAPSPGRSPRWSTTGPRVTVGPVAGKSVLPVPGRSPRPGCGHPGHRREGARRFRC